MNMKLYTFKCAIKGQAALIKYVVLWHVVKVLEKLNVDSQILNKLDDVMSKIFDRHSNVREWVNKKVIGENV